MSKTAPARATAFDILLTLERGPGHSDELLHQPAVEKLSSPDRNLTMNLVMGTLRWQIALDARIAALLAKPKAQLDPAVRIALRLGAFQLLYLDRIPVYAAIGESVELAKNAGNPFAAGMVNAVLRKIAAQPRPKESITVTNTADLGTSYSHPQWLIERWLGNFGLEHTKLICGYDQQPAPAFVRLLTPDAEAELLQEGIELAPASFLANVRTVVQGDVSSTATFQKKLVRMQDEGSQLVAEIAGHGQRILDACAAPGGKTAILAERNPVAAITACDASKRRLDDMQRTLQKALSPPRIDYVAADAAKIKWKPEFDLILCDAPCSGTGTLARNPEIRYRLDADELNRQHQRQAAILASLMRGVKPGGRLLYSTCSLEPEENEAVVHECLDTQDDFELVRLEGEVDRMERDGILLPEGARKLCDTALVNGCLRTLPGVHACDGFFAALLTRQG
jgi:16S rRNA (cytosine967-C5)-methyltransferase